MDMYHFVLLGALILVSFAYYRKKKIEVIGNFSDYTILDYAGLSPVYIISFGNSSKEALANANNYIAYWIQLESNQGYILDSKKYTGRYIEEYNLYVIRVDLFFC